MKRLLSSALLLGSMLLLSGMFSSVQAQEVYDCSQVTEIPQAECEALVTFFNSAGGVGWTNKSSNRWLLTSTPCTWIGVECSEGHVTVLSLSYNNLTGKISDLSALSQLRYLGLEKNKLTGFTNLQGLQNLAYLDIYQNDISESIPNDLIPSLPKLHRLRLHSNKLYGDIPFNFTEYNGYESLTIHNNCLNVPESGVFRNYLNGKDPHFESTQTQCGTDTNPNKPPIAKFSFTQDPQTGELPLKVTMTSTSSDPDGSIVKTEWLINGVVFGSSATSQQYTHTFTTAGTQRIAVRVIDNNGKSVTSTAASVTVIDPTQQPPTDAEIQAAIEQGRTEGRTQCINDPASCGLSVLTEQDKTNAHLAGIEAGKAECINNPQSCGIDAEVIGYISTKRIMPQIIMAGITPSVIDTNLDTNVQFIAVVRPGRFPIDNVTLDFNGEQIASYGMEKANTLSNGDEIWKFDFGFQRNSLGTGELELEWGENLGQLNVRAIDSKQQYSAVFPTVRSGTFGVLTE